MSETGFKLRLHIDPVSTRGLLRSPQLMRTANSRYNEVFLRTENSLRYKRYFVKSEDVLLRVHSSGN